MRDHAVCFPARGQMEFVPVGAPPDPGPTEVVLETLHSGITNGTERHGLMGEHGWDHYPGFHGYQHVCRVVRAGAQVQGLRVADVVFYGDYVGHRPWHVLDVAGPRLVIALPPAEDHGPFALMGVAGVGMRAVRRMGVGSGHNVLVVGVGPIGIFCAQGARAVGAAVTVAELVPRRLQAARETGAHAVVDMGDPDAWQQVRARGPYDFIFDGAGYPRLFHDLFEHRLLAHGATVGAMAVRAGAEFPWPMLHTTEASIAVSCHFAGDDLRALLHLLTTGVVHIEPIVSHRVSIDRAPEIYATLRDDPRSLYGVVFDW